MDLRTTIDRHGRMLIPASIRKELDYHPGDTIILRAINGELHALKLEQVVTEAQVLVSQYLKSGASSLVEELLQMRKEDFSKEEASYNRYSKDTE